MTATGPGIRARRPTGREEVTAALLDAAADLFARRPYNDVTIREIAAAAKVNLGLLHRHFGSKNELLRGVMQRYATHFRDVALEPRLSDGIVRLFKDRSQIRLLRTLAYVVLSDVPTKEFIAANGAISTLLQRHHTRPTATPASRDTDADLVTAFALLMGWSLFEGFLVNASARRVGRVALRKRVFQLAKELSAE